MSRSEGMGKDRTAQKEPLGGLFDGFEAYRTPTDADYSRLFSESLIVPDTNVFLNLYRYNEQTRDDLLSLLRSLGNRLRVPHQVIAEFWRNREKVLQDARDTNKTIQELNEQQNKVTAIFRGWANRVGLPEELKSEIDEVMKSAYSRLTGEVVLLADEDAADFARDTNKDPLIAELNRILEGHVGAALDKTDYDKALAEAKRRSESKIPPGYRDTGKGGENAAGDYLIWIQLLGEVRKAPRDVLIVTGDAKDDWWRRENGELRGPRPELAAEIGHTAGTKLFMLRPESLLLLARRHLNISISDKSVADIERVDKYLEDMDMRDVPPEQLKAAWPVILDGVKKIRRVAWMLLSVARPISLRDNVLTLEFPRKGDLKGFNVSGADAVLADVIHKMFGVHVTISPIPSFLDIIDFQATTTEDSTAEEPSFEYADDPPF